MAEPLNLVMFSGTDDKLQAAAVLTAGAAALGKPVNLFLQYWALDAFRSDRILRDHGLAPEAGEAGRAAVDALARAGQAPWAETLRMAKDVGAVDIQACSLSMDLLGLTPSDLDPLVDGVEGVTAFSLNAGDGQVVFI
jgi:peroxiredoxin family protein